MANTNINPFGSSAVMPAGYPIADDLNTNSAQQALSAKQGKRLGDELHSIKILVVGNSYSCDSFSYVPIILKTLGINVEIGILYHSGCKLEEHWDNRAAANYYIFHHFPSANGKWESSSNSAYNKSLNDGLDYADWDVVVFQQSSARSVDYSTFQPFLNDLISLVATKLPNVKIGWNLTHSWADGNANYGVIYPSITEHLGMDAAIKSAVEHVIAETAVELIFPYGRALHYARENDTLDALGDGGEMCYSDKTHLQEGIGCLVASYANAEAILRFLGSKKTVLGDETDIDATFLSNYAIPEQHGTSVGSTAANRLIAQRCAVMANNEY